VYMAEVVIHEPDLHRRRVILHLVPRQGRRSLPRRWQPAPEGSDRGLGCHIT
jgi:hypothetical protein